MNIYPLQEFEAQITEELEIAWQRIRTLKPDVLGLVNERKQWEEFEKAYGDHFQEMEQERSRLVRQRISLERQIQRQNRRAAAPTIDDIALPDMPDAIEIDATGISDVQNAASGTHEGESIEVAIDWDDGGDEPEPEDMDTDLPKPDAPSTYSNKRLVARPFRFMYHARSITETTDKFYNERMRILARLTNDESLDEVDILAQMPFLERDEKMWKQALTKEIGFSHKETDGERLIRYRLWVYLLEIAHKRENRKVEERKRHLNDTMYTHYTEWKKSHYREMPLFFQTIEQSKRDDIQELQDDIEELQRIANE